MDSVTRALTHLADGDRDAFDLVYEAAWPRVHALASKMLGSGAEADDIAQQALLAVFSRASEYDPSVGPALPWILGIAGWTVRTHRKQQSRRREVAVPEGLCAPDTPESQILHADLVAAVREVLGTLSELDQETLLLAASGDRPRDATFRKRLQRAMTRFRLSFGRSHGPL